MIALGSSPRLGTFIRLRDSYGNTYTYGHLAKLATVYPVAKPAQAEPAARSAASSASSASDPAPTHAATAGGQVQTAPRTAATRPPPPRPARPASRRHRAAATPEPASTPAPATPVVSTTARAGDRAHAPHRPVLAPPAPGLALPELAPLHPDASTAATGDEAAPTTIPAGVSAFRAVFAEPDAIDRRDVVLKPLRRGAKVIGGTVIGRIGAASLDFAAPQGADAEAEQRAETRRRRDAEASPTPRTSTSRSGPPAAKTPRIDPKPLLDGWRLLDSTAIYRAAEPGAERRRGHAAPPLDRRDHADEQGAAHAARARQPGHRDLRVRPRGHPRRHRRPPRPRLARVPRRARHEADRHEPALRPRLLHRERQRLRALQRRRRRRRRDQRRADRRPPGPGLDHRPRRARAAHPAGHDEARTRSSR